VLGFSKIKATLLPANASDEAGAAFS